MKIIEIKSLEIPDIKVIRFARFKDHRGFFTESYRQSDFKKIDFLKDVDFLQCNESYSKGGTIRGLHYQWNPFMGKLIRTINGRMIDFFLDIRKKSPTFGKIAAYDMPSSYDDDFSEWIWVPVGFAHGNCFTAETLIQYFCSGSYNPECEAGISPFASDLDWSLCNSDCKSVFDDISSANPLITDKDKEGYSLSDWNNHIDSDNFLYS